MKFDSQIEVLYLGKGLFFWRKVVNSTLIQEMGYLKRLFNDNEPLSVVFIILIWILWLNDPLLESGTI